MDYKNTDNMIELLTQFIRSQIQDDSAESLIIFAQQYFKFAVFDELESKSIEDLYGAVLAHWSLFLDLSPNTEILHIYNPTIEEHGWQSTHTVIEMVLADHAFILQSVTMEINRCGFSNQMVLHPVYWVQRDMAGKFIAFVDPDTEGAKQESVLHIEINRQTSEAALQQLQQCLQKVLTDVQAATEDWGACVEKIQQEIAALTQISNKTPELQESIAFLEWLKNDHFVFLGYREYQIIEQQEQYGFAVLEQTGLGVLRDSIADIPVGNFQPINKDSYQLLHTDSPLVITKATSKSTVHRPVFMDYIGIKQYDSAANVIGEKRFLGLYSSAVYSCELNTIPLVRNKVSTLLQQSRFISSAYTERALLFVLNSLPRDELFLANIESLTECSTGILQLQERHRVRVFVRHEIYAHFVSLLVYVPRERFSTDSRNKIQAILLEIFQGNDLDFTVKLTESALARVHFIIHTQGACCLDYDVKDIEQRIIAALSNWHDELEEELHLSYAEAEANKYFQAYRYGFSAAYREAVSARTALVDLKRFEQMEREDLLVLGFLYSPLTATGKKQLYFKLYCFGKLASLSRSLPMLENMGVMVCSEHPYEIKKQGQKNAFWIHDFGLAYAQVEELDIAELKPRFQEAFEQCWQGRVENDGFNALVVSAGLTWQEINIIRALYFYLRQVGIAFSQSYVEQTLVHNAPVVALLVHLFSLRFNTADFDDKDLLIEINNLIEQVRSLDEDRILRRYLNLILAAERTNFFKQTVDELGIPYFSIKFNSAKIEGLPSPIPYYEIFVYSPRVEGIHLRGGAVARGGLRWSDRREDFRTEVLGLMKAQMTKNAVIVPTGSKGGFVLKSGYTKEQLAAEGVACYQLFIKGLLDITDNYVGDAVSKPKDVICYDVDDPYLVVAADKGTASFSDYANVLSQSYDYWLGDAFASGGSVGYDHKKMGITARGAWVSVEHHFASLDRDIQKQTFTAVGIGGMSGDVFGNGLLLSDKIKLVAAFDHESIFLDPNPNPEISFTERQRLFALKRSKWSDYDASLLSVGGGVFSRAEKLIELSEEVQLVLAIDKPKLSANELIKSILLAPVDLLWNGGIGTYVKARDESNAEVGDRANDALRINGEQLLCKVVAEGGNLGFTQKGRIEYALNQGCINTDSIDNSAGVDCSDHEVNIKILLNSLMLQGDMTEKQRNLLLASMTEQVAELVLHNNYQQNHAISMIHQQSLTELHSLKTLMGSLEVEANLDCALENLPNDKVLQARKIAGQGMTRPEISVLLAYSKQHLKTTLLSEASCINLELFKHVLADYFPKQLQTSYAQPIQSHRLGKEIVANQLINSLVNRLGIIFPQRFMQELNCSAAELVNTYQLVCRVFDIDSLWKMQSELDTAVGAESLDKIKWQIRKWVERAMYWFMRNEPQAEAAEHYVENIAELEKTMSSFVGEQEQKQIDADVDVLIQQGVSAPLALKVAQSDVLLACLNAVNVHKQFQYGLADVSQVLFKLRSQLNLNWLRNQILQLPKESSWEALSRRTMIHEYNQVCCVLLQSVLAENEQGISAKIEAWQTKNNLAFERYMTLLQSAEADDGVQLERIVVILGVSWGLTIYGN